jgi:hypothetical protein
MMARSMSALPERGISQIGLPVIGEILVKYPPATGATHSPPMKFP